MLPLEGRVLVPIVVRLSFCHSFDSVHVFDVLFITDVGLRTVPMRLACGSLCGPNVLIY